HRLRLASAQADPEWTRGMPSAGETMHTNHTGTRNLTTDNTGTESDKSPIRSNSGTVRGTSGVLANSLVKQGLRGPRPRYVGWSSDPASVGIMPVRVAGALRRPLRVTGTATQAR